MSFATRKILPRLLTVAIASLPVVGVAQDEAAPAAPAAAVNPAKAQAEAYLDQYFDAPILVKNMVPANQPRLLLRQILSDEIESSPAETPQAYINIPMKELLETKDYEFRYLGITDSDYSRAVDLIRESKPGAALSILRPAALPAVKFLTISNEYLNIHELVKMYFQALVDSNQFHEGSALARRMPLEKLDPEYLNLVLSLIVKMVEEEQNEEAMSLIDYVPFSEKTVSMFPQLMDFAALLRNNQNYVEALRIYERVQTVRDTEQFSTALQYTAYCNARLGRPEAAKNFLARAEKPEFESQNHSLRSLTEALIALSTEDYKVAMDRASEAVVYSKLVSDWTPEARYLTGFCYEKVGRYHAAIEVYDEIKIYYPQNAWTEKGQSRVPAVMKEIARLEAEREALLTKEAAVNEEPGLGDAIQ